MEILNSEYVSNKREGFRLPSDIWKYKRIVWSYDIGGDICRDMLAEHFIEINAVEGTTNFDPETGYHSWDIEKGIVFTKFSGTMTSKIIRCLGDPTSLVGYHDCLQYIRVKYTDPDDKKYDYDVQLEYDEVNVILKSYFIDDNIPDNLHLTIYGVLDEKLIES